MTIGVALVAIPPVAWKAPGGMWSASAVYLLVVGVFQFGLTWVVGLDALSDEARALAQVWLFRPVTAEAIYLACLGVAACATGATLAHVLTPLKRDERRHALGRGSEAAISLALARVGGLLVMVSVGVWFTNVVRAGGLFLFFGSYVVYLEVTAPYGDFTALVWFGMGVGLPFLAAAEPTTWHRFGIGAFLLFCAFGLPIGLRGEVLFPSLAAVVWARWRRPPPGSVLILGAAVLLMLIPVPRDVRQGARQRLGDQRQSAGWPHRARELAEAGGRGGRVEPER